MMKNLYRVWSVILILTGICLVYVYLFNDRLDNKFNAFDKPSYYVTQNLLYLYAAGTAAIAFSVIACFFSWFKSLELAEVMLNAGYASKEEINTWIEGSSLDGNTGIENADNIQNVLSVYDEDTEILENDATEILASNEEVKE